MHFKKVGDMRFSQGFEGNLAKTAIGNFFKMHQIKKHMETKVSGN